MIVVNRCFEAYIDGLYIYYIYIHIHLNMYLVSVCHLKLEVDFCVSLPFLPNIFM